MTDLAIVIIVMVACASFCFCWLTFFVGRQWTDKWLDACNKWWHERTGGMS